MPDPSLAGLAGGPAEKQRKTDVRYRHGMSFPEGSQSAQDSLLQPDGEPVSPAKAVQLLYAQIRSSMGRLRPGVDLRYVDVDAPYGWGEEGDALPAPTDPGLPERRNRERRVIQELRAELRHWIAAWSARTLPPGTGHGQCHARHPACAVLKEFLSWMPLWYALADLPEHLREDAPMGARRQAATNGADRSTDNRPREQL